MMLFYVDESGTGLGDKRSAYFVLAAVGIEAQNCPLVDRKVSDLKRQLVSWAKPEDFEIKGRDLRHGEKLFRGRDWPSRLSAIQSVAQMIADLPCRVLAVQLDKRDLPEHIASDDMYRLALSRLLDLVDAELVQTDKSGMLMVDARSTLHTAVQDRRLLDAYRDWLGSRSGATRLLELPWFGFSAFYAGLQLADFCAYLIDFATNEHISGHEDSELWKAYTNVQPKVRLTRIP